MQADFRANDRDGNGVADYWTGDVYNLYALCPDGKLDRTMMIKLIEPALAGADARPLLTPWTMAVDQTVIEFSPKSNFVFGAWPGPQPDGKPYRVSTKGPLKDCYNPSSYAFYAAPMVWKDNRRVFTVAEDNTIFEVFTPSSYQAERDEKTLRVSFKGSGPFQPEGPFPADRAAVGWRRHD